MYRAVTLYFLRHDLDWNDPQTVRETLPKISLHFEPDAAEGTSPIFMNGENVSEQIRTMEVTNNVSPVSTVTTIRRFLVAQQQEIGRGKGVVAEGRDIGTVVFPEAEVKVFMQADMESRVRRRQKQLQEQGHEVAATKIRANLSERDRLDTTRQDSPLHKAEDAIVLDTSDTTFEEQVSTILDYVQTAIRQKSDAQTV